MSPRAYISGRCVAVTAALGTAGVLIIIAGRSLWGPTAPSLNIANAGAPSQAAPASAPTLHEAPAAGGPDVELDAFLYELNGLRARLNDPAALRSVLRHVDAYQPYIDGSIQSRAEHRQSVFATASLGMVAAAWTLHGPIPGLRESSVANAVRLTEDPSLPLRAMCAAMLKAVHDKPGDQPLTPDHARLMDALLAEQPIRSIVEQSVAAWQEKGP